MRIQPKTIRSVELISQIFNYFIVKVKYEDKSEGIYIEKFGSSSQSPMHAETVALEALEEELQIRKAQIERG